MYLYKLKHWGALAIGLGLTLNIACAQTDLVVNGKFGKPVYVHGGTSQSNPSTVGWTITANGSAGGAVKLQSVAPGCNQFYCYGASAYNWYGIGGAAQVGLVATQFSQAIKANTRYRLSFHVFRDITSIATTDTTYSLPADLQVRLSSDRGSYLLKDIKVPGYTFGGYKPGVQKAVSFEFVTPVASTDQGKSNLNLNQLFFKWPAYNKYFLAFTDIKLEEIPAAADAPKVVVNTYGYPTLGSKVATLVLPQGTSTSGLKWRLRYGNSLATTSYGVGISFYAVVTGNDGLPLKNASGGYTLQTNADGTLRVIGGTGTGGQGSYIPASDGLLTAVTPVLDKDSGQYLVNLDFSNYGVPGTNVSPPVTDGSVAPSLYTAPDGNSYYMLSGSKTSYSSGSCCGANYYIDVSDSSGKRVAVSPNFVMTNSPFTPLKKDALYSFYHQRSGLAIDPLFGKQGYGNEKSSLAHAAGHKPDLAGCWANAASKVDAHGNDWGSSTSNCISHAQDVSGGWYDAADHGKYVVNGGVTLWTLQNLIERLQHKNTLNAAFPVGELSLPATVGDNNSNLNISDLLAEARVEMEWMLKMQAPDTFRMKVPLSYQDRKLAATTETNGVYPVNLYGNSVAQTAPGAIDFAGGKLPRLRMKLKLSEVDVGGLVFHAVHDRNWTGIPLDPSKDTQERVLMYPTTAATLNFAATAAQCSRIWKSVDSAFADRCFNAAVKAWDSAKKFRIGFIDSFNNVIPAKSDIFRYEYSNQPWDAVDTSLRNKSVLQYGFAVTPMFGGGGAYGDLRVGDEFYWAGAELYLATAARGSADLTYHTYGKAQGVLSAGDIHGQYSKCEQSVEPIQCYAWINGFDWQNTSSLGTLSLLTYSGGSLASATAKTNLTAFADKLVTQANSQGYKFAKQVFDAGNRDTHYEWGANGGVLNRSLILGAAVDIQTDAAKKANYLAAMVNSMGYLLGRNVMEKSHISGYGNNSMANPHHRWFAKHADVAYPLVPAGFISGGPNTRDIPALRANAPRYETQADVNWAIANGDPDATLGGISDPSQRYFDSTVVAKCMDEAAAGTLPSYVPQKCYADHYRSFATNEVAVNWQAPLVWVSQFLSEHY